MTNPPEHKHPPTQFHQEPNRGMPYIPRRCEATFAAPQLLLLTSYISRQLFIRHQSTGRTFPVAQEASEPKVHEVSRNSPCNSNYRAVSFLVIISCSYRARWFPHRVPLLVPFVSYAIAAISPAIVPCGFPQGLYPYISRDRQPTAPSQRLIQTSTVLCRYSNAHRLTVVSFFIWRLSISFSFTKQSLSSL